MLQGRRDLEMHESLPWHPYCNLSELSLPWSWESGEGNVSARWINCSQRLGGWGWVMLGWCPFLLFLPSWWFFLGSQRYLLSREGIIIIPTFKKKIENRVLECFGYQSSIVVMGSAVEHKARFYCLCPWKPKRSRCLTLYSQVFALQYPNHILPSQDLTGMQPVHL